MNFNDNLDAIITGLFTTLLWFFNHKLNNNKKQIDLNKITIEDIVKPVLDDIQFELKATRVSYLELKNGEYTASGHSLKSLRMIEESISEGTESSMDDFKILPLSMFKRNIDKLRHDDDIITSKEFQLNDKESELYRLYDMNNIIMCRIHTKNNKWTGILVIGFKDIEKDFDEEELTWIYLKSKYLGSLLKQH